MDDFGDIDDFNEHAVQGKPIKAYKNGHFENPKGIFVLFISQEAASRTDHGCCYGFCCGSAICAAPLDVG